MPSTALREALLFKANLKLRSKNVKIIFSLSASIAQLVEQLPLKQLVVGSSPTGGTENGPVLNGPICFLS